MSNFSRILTDALIDSDTGSLAAGSLLYLAEHTDLPATTHEDLRAIANAVQNRPGRTPYRHPADSVRPFEAEDPSLNAADIAWLNALPADPTQVSYDDACHLARLAARVDNNKANASERRLVEQRWLPVRDAHDKREAQHTLSREYGTFPDPVNALAELIRRETPAEVTDRECVTRACELRDHIHTEINSRRERTRDAALKVLDDVRDRAAERSATTAPTDPTPQHHTTYA